MGSVNWTVSPGGPCPLDADVLTRLGSDRQRLGH